MPFIHDLIRHIEIGRDYIHVVAGTDSFFLFLNLHLVKVCDFPLDGLNGFGLVDTADSAIS